MSSKLLLENGNNVVESENFKVIFKKLSVPLEPYERVRVYDIEILQDAKNSLSFSLSQIMIPSPTALVFEYSLDFSEVTNEDFLVKIYSTYPTFESIANDCIEYYKTYVSKILSGNDFAKFNAQKKAVAEQLKKVFPTASSIRFNGYIGSLICLDFSPKMTAGSHTLLAFYENGNFTFINSISSFESFLSKNSSKLGDSFFTIENVSKILGIFGSVSQVGYQYVLVEDPKVLEYSPFFVESDSELVSKVKSASSLIFAPKFENNSLSFCALSLNYPTDLYHFKISKSGSTFKIIVESKMEKIYLPDFVVRDFSK